MSEIIKLINTIKNQIKERKKGHTKDKYNAKLKGVKEGKKKIKKDIEKFKWEKNKTIKQKQIANTYAKQLGADWFADRHNQDLDKIIKTLNSALKKCQK